MEGVTNISGRKLMRPYAEVFASNVHAHHICICVLKNGFSGNKVVVFVPNVCVCEEYIGILRRPKRKR